MQVCLGIGAHVLVGNAVVGMGVFIIVGFRKGNNEENVGCVKLIAPLVSFSHK